MVNEQGFYYEESDKFVLVYKDSKTLNEAITKISNHFDFDLSKFFTDELLKIGSKNSLSVSKAYKSENLDYIQSVIDRYGDCPMGLKFKILLESEIEKMSWVSLTIKKFEKEDKNWELKVENYELHFS
jgi:hypothetical protein